MSKKLPLDATREVETVYYWLLGVVEDYGAFSIKNESYSPGGSFSVFTFRVYGDNCRTSQLLRPRFGPSVTPDDVKVAMALLNRHKGIFTDEKPILHMQQVNRINIRI